MDWETLLCRERLGKPVASDDELGRTPFHKDHDRVIFSGAFRRLGKKTQVHPVSSNDHIHTRLTHSLEVGCVGRSLGMRVGEMLRSEMPDWCQPADLGVIVQAACLAHDIGNPPYGHSGEDAIRHWFRQAEQRGMLDQLSDAEKQDFLHFEGNAQGFRVLTQIEYHQAEGGMRLTYATLGAYLKYPWTAQHANDLGYKKHKFGCYQAEFPLLQQIAGKLGLPALGPHRWARHPLVYLVEAADDICYGLIDLEDGIELGLLRYEEVENLIQPLLSEQWEVILDDLEKADNPRRRLQMLRGQAMEAMVNAVASAFIRQQDSLLSGTLQGSIIDYCPEEVRNLVNGAKQMARERIFNDSRKLAIEVGSYATLSVLLENFLGAVRENVQTGKATFRNRRIIELMGRSAPGADWTLYDAYMRALDYISGMTDNYAAEMARQFSGYQPD